MKTIPVTNLREATAYSAVAHLVFYGLVIALPLLLVLGVLLFRSIQTERQQLERNILQVLHDLSGDLDRDFDRHIIVLNTLATSLLLKSGSWPEFYDQAKAALQGQGYIVLVDATGRQIVNTYVPYGQEPEFTGDPETVKRMLESKRPVISNLFMSLVVKKPVFNISIPIKSDGEVRYVMSLGLLPDDLVTILEARKLGPEWVTTLWDAHGVVLARTRDAARFIGTTVPQRLRPTTKDPAVFKATNLDEEQVLRATVISELSGWGVAVNVPISLAEKRLRAAIGLWGGATLVAIILTTWLGFVFGRTLANPIAAVSNAAAALGRGERLRLLPSRLREVNALGEVLLNAERELEKRTTALRRSEEHFRLAVEASPSGMILTDNEGRIVMINAQAEKLLGHSRDDLIGRPIEMLLPERFREKHRMLRVAYVAQPSTRAMGAGRDLFVLRADGREVPVEIGLSPISTEQGSMILSAIVDITERKQAEETQTMLVRELQHRTSNLFAVVQAVAHQSLSRAPSLAEAKAALEPRLQALARANQHLLKQNWKGVQLRELVQSELEPFGERIVTEGADVLLGPQQAQNFSLALHELATNAVKYGALSNDVGKVQTSWMTDDENILKFKWRESGGPSVAEPTRRGFGSTLLRTICKGVRIDYAKEGLDCELEIVLSAPEPLRS